jgi:hypothetical protein
MNDENVWIESANSIVDWMTKIGLMTGCITDPHDIFAITGVRMLFAMSKIRTRMFFLYFSVLCANIRYVPR